MSRRSNLLVRTLVVAVMALALGGPTPGHISGCNTQPGVADPVWFCREYESLVCRREHAAGRIDEAEHMACHAAVPTNCAGRNWPVGCAPSRATTQACLQALGDTTRIYLLPEALPECQAVCPGSGGGLEPEGI